MNRAGLDKALQDLVDIVSYGGTGHSLPGAHKRVSRHGWL